MMWMGIFRYKGEEMQFYLSLALVILGCVYLTFDLLIIIMPGVVNKDDYILAALMLYMDIAQIFWNLLILMS